MQRESQQSARSQQSQMSETSQTSYPVPFGHVPYTPALPGAMGPIWDVPLEWWYYGGWAADKTGSKQFTILMQTIREEKPAAAILYGIGMTTPDGAEQQFTTNTAVGLGEFPPPTSNSWSTALETWTPIQSTMTCTLTSGTLGLPGAEYQLEMADKTNDIAASLSLKDTFGMILEGASGAFHKTGGGNSYEFAMPSMVIQEGSTITLNGAKTTLGSGNLWLDRQTIGPNVSGEKMTLNSQPAEKASNPLYVGNWLAVSMNDRTCYVLVFMWPKRSAGEQWIVGTELQPPVNPSSKFGLEYLALPTWDGHSPVQGVNELTEEDFDFNLLQPAIPASSPHWKSPKSSNVYATAWHLRIRDQVYTVTALLPQSEVFLGTYFFEGTALIEDSAGHEVGRVFVEQMGYN